jgi:heptosyltransferase-2/heptosyltransferase-3
VVEKDFPCRFSCDEDVCRHSVNNECMAAVSVEDVLGGVKNIINQLNTNMGNNNC